MAWYYGTYACGHEGRTNIIGPGKNREWLSDRHFEKMCSECYEKHLQEEREKANKEAEEKAILMELPLLQGTEKQVAWANTLRQKMIDDFEERIEIVTEKFKGIDEKIGELRNILNFILETKISASWYIDNRKESLESLFRRTGNEMKLEEVIVEKDIKIESTVRPENAVTEVVAEITVKSDKITVKFEKNDKFREIVKALKFEWTGVWEREIDEFNGSAEDRAAELGNKLLNAGFPIMIIDPIILQNSVEGKFEHECTRWIYIRAKGEHEGKFAVNWSEKNDRIYEASRKITGSKYDRPSVIVRIEHYKEVEDFANLFGFKFSKKAIKAIEQHKKNIELSKVVVPKKVSELSKIDGLDEILKSSDEIINDLKEE